MTPVIHNAVRRRGVNVSDDIAGPEQLQDFRKGRRRVANMDHDGNFQWVRNLTGPAKHFQIQIASDAAGEARLNSDDPFSIPFRGRAAFGGIGRLDTVEELATSSRVVSQARNVEEDA